MTSDDVPLALLRTVCARFGLDGPLTATRSAGRKNRSWHVRSPQGSVHLREVRDGKDAATLASEHALTERLAAAGVPAVRWRPTTDGAAWLETAGVCFVVQPFVAGGPPTRTPVDAALCGAALARTHAVLAGVDALVTLDPPPLHEVLAGQALTLPDDLGTEVLSVAGAVKHRWDDTTWVHGGARRSSYLLDGGEVVAVLDLDSARRAPHPLDAGTFLHSLARSSSLLTDDVPLREPLVRATAAGYRGVRPAGDRFWADALVMAAGLMVKRALSGELPREDGRRRDEVLAAARLAAGADAVAARWGLGG